MTIITKRNDTRILFTDTPTIDGVPMTPEQLADCTLSFLMKGRADDGTDVAIKAPAVITEEGLFQYAPTAEDVAHAGKFRQEWELVFPDTTILTFPNNGQNTVMFTPDLG